MSCALVCVCWLVYGWRLTGWLTQPVFTRTPTDTHTHTQVHRTYQIFNKCKNFKTFNINTTPINVCILDWHILRQRYSVAQAPWEWSNQTETCRCGIKYIISVHLFVVFIWYYNNAWYRTHKAYHGAVTESTITGETRKQTCTMNEKLCFLDYITADCVIRLVYTATDHSISLQGRHVPAKNHRTKTWQKTMIHSRDVLLSDK
jgi:hypothetical protein